MYNRLVSLSSLINCETGGPSRGFGPDLECMLLMSSTPLRSFVVFFAVAFSLQGPLPARAEGKQPTTEPRWPLDMPTRFLTSNFMEYRSGRFHAGIDLKTDSREGFAVRAAEDGYITRVRATPFAYGRAVYVRGNSGRTYVYAHLMRFNDELRGLVRRQQEENGRYRARLFFQAGQVPVRRGQVLGLSGQAGTGGPHLHLEVRDEAGRPVNPHDHGFPINDKEAPVISALTAWPADPAARINGATGEHRLQSASQYGGELPPLHIEGAVAFSARMVDHSDRARHRLEPWLIQVELDGEMVYSCRNESFDFSENSQQRLEWAEHTALGRDFRERWLHRHPAVQVAGRQGGLWYLGPDGAGLSPGAHRLRMSAQDRFGNRTAVEVPLVVGESTGPEQSPWQEVDLSLVTEDGLRLSPFFTAGLSPDRLDVLSFSPLDGDPVLAPVLVLSSPLGSFPITKPFPAGLQPLTLPREYQAAHWPVDGPLQVYLAPVPDLPPERPLDDRTSVYCWGRGGGWGLVAPAEVRGDSLFFPLAEPGLHVLIQDGAPPEFEIPRDLIVAPAKESEAEGVTLGRWEVFSVGLKDNGSGVATETIAVKLDGAPLLVEPDLPRKRLLVELPDETPPGPHRLDLEVQDRAGNSATAWLGFSCVRGEP